jgi:hypothetical protein
MSYFIVSFLFLGGYFVGSCENLFWVIVLRLVVLFMGFCTSSVKIFYCLLCVECRKIFIGYCAVSGGNLVWVIVLQVVGICYGI